MVVREIALAVRGEIAVTGDMVPTTVFDLSVMVRLNGLPTCSKADLVLLHQCVTVLAIIVVLFLPLGSLVQLLAVLFLPLGSLRLYEELQ